jgi:hypothetical protein
MEGITICLSVLFFLMIQGSGCGTTEKVVKVTKKAYKSVTSSDPKLKKKVLVMPIMDQAGVGTEKIDQLTSLLVENLKKDGTLLVYRSESPLPTGVKMKSPKYGIVIDPDLAKSAEERGMNALVTCVLNPFEVHVDKPGIWPLNKINLRIWPFDKIERNLDVSTVVNALDIINGTLFVTSLLSERIEIPEEPEDEEILIVQEAEEKTDDDWRAMVPEAEKTRVIGQLLQDQADAIIDGLREKPWSGRILSADRKNIVINAGRDVGLENDNIFEVFDRGDPIESVSGRALYLMGDKIGEIKIAQIKETYSSAVPLSGDRFRAGQIIKIKR